MELIIKLIRFLNGLLIYAQVEKTKEERSLKNAENKHTEHPNSESFYDNSSEAIEARRLQDISGNSPQTLKMLE